MEDQTELISVITCTYNRASTLSKVYESLCEQTYRHFEWIVADDGSSDNTREIVQNWIDEGAITIRYFYQENNGKHIATNEAMKIARGTYVMNMDSDDYMRRDAMETFIHAWHSIPPEKRNEYFSVKARCFDATTGEAIGKEIPGGRLDCHYLEAKYRYKIQFEMWAMCRLEAVKEYPNPDIRGGRAGGGLRFYPEGISQDLASRKYRTLLINDALRAYTRDTSTSLMGRGVKYNRSRENIYLWTHILNDNFDYFWSDPKSFIKAAVGVSMDTLLLRNKMRDAYKILRGWRQRWLVALLLPLGWVCYLRRR